MRLICSWCNKPMGEKEPLLDPRISHSLCPECFDAVLAEGFDDVVNGEATDEYQGDE